MHPNLIALHSLVRDAAVHRARKGVGSAYCAPALPVGTGDFIDAIRAATSRTARAAMSTPARVGHYGSSSAFAPIPLCPLGQELWVRLVDSHGNSANWGPDQRVTNPGGLSPPIPVGYHWYYYCLPIAGSVVYGGNQPLTASQALTRALREQAMPANQPAAPRGGGGGGSYRHGPLGVHGLPAGLGIPGPYGKVLKEMIPADLYEISGTQVALHDPNIDPSTLAPGTGVIGYLNNKYGDNGGIVVGEPDTVMSNGQTADAHGFSWVQVAVDGGALNGKAGYVSAQYLAPRGWTASHGGTAAAPNPAPPPPVVDPNQDRNPNAPPLAMTGAMPASWTPWLIGGAAALAVGLVGWSLYGTKKGKAVRRLGRIKYHHALHKKR